MCLYLKTAFLQLERVSSICHAQRKCFPENELEAQAVFSFSCISYQASTGHLGLRQYFVT